jgi:hypothetical protein
MRRKERRRHPVRQTQQLVGKGQGGLRLFILSFVFAAVCLALGSSTCGQSQSPAQQPQPAILEQKLQNARYDLRIVSGRFTGSAAVVLENAIREAHFVLVGEDHLTREVPEFTAGVCDVMGPTGFSAMALEVSPEVADFLSASLGKSDRIARMTALVHRYPDSVAFMNMRQENDLVSHCAQVSSDPNFQLWGLDQPFIGSSGWLLDQILSTHPGPTATAALSRLKEEEQRDAAQAQETGDPTKVFLLSASDAELANAVTALERDGNPTANRLLEELMESREIYLKNIHGDAIESNKERARLLKQNLKQHLDASGGNRKRVLVKFGNSHLYKGFNELHQLDLGDYIAEVADVRDSSALYICVLGAKGTHLLYGGYDRPGKLEPFTLDEASYYPWIKPALDNMVPNGWTLYDLRKLRFQALGPIDVEMQRLIYAYDLLVIAPEITPANPIQ